MAVAGLALLVACVANLLKGRMGPAVIFGVTGLLIGGGAGAIAAYA